MNIYKSLFLFISSLVSLSVLADDGHKRAIGLGETHINTAMITQILSSLMFIIVIILLAAVLFRKYGGFSKPSGKDLGVVSGFNIGSKERIVLIQAGQQQILVGVGPGVIQKIHVLDQPLAKDNVVATGKKSKGNSKTNSESFMAKLTSELRKMGA